MVSISTDLDVRTTSQTTHGFVGVTTLCLEEFVDALVFVTHVAIELNHLPGGALHATDEGRLGRVEAGAYTPHVLHKVASLSSAEGVLRLDDVAAPAFDAVTRQYEWR